MPEVITRARVTFSLIVPPRSENYLIEFPRRLCTKVKTTTRVSSANLSRRDVYLPSDHSVR